MRRPRVVRVGPAHKGRVRVRRVPGARRGWEARAAHLGQQALVEQPRWGDVESTVAETMLQLCDKRLPWLGLGQNLAMSKEQLLYRRRWNVATELSCQRKSCCVLCEI